MQAQALLHVRTLGKGREHATEEQVQGLLQAQLRRQYGGKFSLHIAVFGKRLVKSRAV